MLRSSDHIRPSLLLVYVLEVRVDAPGLLGAAFAARRRRRAGGTALLVHLRADLHRLLPQGVHGPAELADVRRMEDLPERLDLLLDGLARGVGHTGPQILELLLHLVDQAVRQVPQLDELAAPAVVLRVGLRVADRVADL